MRADSEVEGEQPRENHMQTAVTAFRLAHPCRSRNLDWQFLACWLTYFVLGVTIGYSLFSYCVL